MRRALTTLTMIFALALGETGCSLPALIGKPIGTKVGAEIGKAVPVAATTKDQVKGGDVCDVLPKLGWPRRLPEKTIQTIDGVTLRVVLDTNDTVKACP